MNGLLCINKPKDITSFACCGVFKRILGTKKIGHAGTLDPMATGVLPLMIGRATKAFDLFPVQDKRYETTLRFGLKSDTEDIWGKVTPYSHSFEMPKKSEVEKVLASFRGEILQIPPMVSALKKDGVRLYDLARKGIEVEREARPVNIYSLNLLNYNEPDKEITLDCECSKGTYIRTLCTDIGKILGVGAVMTSLNRTMSHGYILKDCIGFEEAKNMSKEELSKLILPVDTAFKVYDFVTVSSAQAIRFSNGGELALNRLEKNVEGIVRVYGPLNNDKDIFLGLGCPKEDSLWIHKLFI